MSDATGHLLALALARRDPLTGSGELEAVRLVNGAGDRLPGVHVDRLGDRHGSLLFVHVDESVAFGPLLVELIGQCAPHWIVRKLLRRDVRAKTKEELLPEVVFTASSAPVGSANLEEFSVRERAWRFRVRPLEGYSHGLFLDQRDNRTALAARVAEWVAARAKTGAPPPAVLNLFSYTGSFSVAAASAGARVTSVDLSARYLDWSRRNFGENGLDPAAHEFAKGDALVFLEIAAKRERRFDLLILDPPTFSTSKQRGVFQVEKNYAKLFELACRVAAPEATLLASHNQRTLEPRALATKLSEGARAASRRVLEFRPFPTPPDFPGDLGENPASRGFWVTLD